MSRLPPIPRDDLDPAGQRLWDQWVGERGEWLVGEDGGLIGPFNAFLRSPEVTSAFASAGDALRAHSVIPPELLQLAIITALGHWHAEFAFGGHAAGAVKLGLDESVVEAIVAGAEPELDASQSAIYVATKQLVATGHLDDGAYSAVSDLLGERGLVELVVAVGFYTFTAFTLNTFEIGPMPGLAPRWPAG